VSGADVLAPDARLRAPKRALPPGTVDCHAHIFDRFEKYGFSTNKKYFPPRCSREDWLALHAALGVARGVQVNASPYGFDNSITADFLREYPGRFVGVDDLKKLDAAGFRAASRRSAGTSRSTSQPPRTGSRLSRACAAVPCRWCSITSAGRAAPKASTRRDSR